MNMQELMKYSKEELAIYILKHCFLDKNIEIDMQHIHCQLLLEKDREFTDKEHEEEITLLNRLHKMPSTTLEEQVERIKVYKQYKELSAKNTVAYEKRQKEINKLMGIKKKEI